MITSTFCHIEGIGEATEQKIWDAGILNWDDFLASNDIPLSSNKIKTIKNGIDFSKEALKSRDHEYFSFTLPSKLHWRIFGEFKYSVAYLDIETTGLSPEYNEITTCAIYDGSEIKYYINGDNLDQFIKDINNYSVIVTYNGKGFDIPFIEHYFGIQLQNSHIDLRYILASLGYSGGLKGCEKQFGLSRNDLEGIDGRLAVYLWDEYKKGDKNALDTLLAYNIEDVVNLEHLMHQSYNLKLHSTCLVSVKSLEVPDKPEPIFSPNVELVKKLGEKYFPWLESI